MTTETWRSRLVEDEKGILELARKAKRIAVLGIKTEAQASQPAYSVPRYMQANGAKIIPVPVYFPECTQILGEPVYRKVADVPGDIDLLNVFRRPKDLAAHLDDILAKKPASVWLQLGIRDDAFAQALAEAGILVVQDRCLMVDHMRAVRQAV